MPVINVFLFIYFKKVNMMDGPESDGQ